MLALLSTLLLGANAYPEHVFFPSDTHAYLESVKDDPNHVRHNRAHYGKAPKPTPAEPKLFVFLPGTGGEPAQCSSFMSTAVDLDFHVLGLMYHKCPLSSGATAVWCDTYKPGDFKCQGDIIKAGWVGGEMPISSDSADMQTVHIFSSAVYRTLFALEWLHAKEPTAGWDNFFTVGGTVDQIKWDMVTVAGHSQGGSRVGYFGKHLKEVAGVVMLSGPQDTHSEQNWCSEDVNMTPPHRFKQLLQSGESAGAEILANMEQMGIYGVHSVPDIDAALESPGAWESAGVQIINSNVDEYIAEGLTFCGSRADHCSTAMDPRMPRTEDGLSVYAQSIWPWLNGKTTGCKTSYALIIPDAGSAPQKTCKGARIMGHKGKKTDAECRAICDADSECTAYWRISNGWCSFYKTCNRFRQHTKVHGPSYYKVCSGFYGTIGMSWANMKLERWARDEAAIKAAVEKDGALYVAKDAKDDADQQVQDIIDLVQQGVDAIIILAKDASKLGPACAAAHARGIPVIAYDRLIDDEKVFYVTFDNVEVGRLQAKAVLAAQPTGKYVMIKGDLADANAHFVRAGQQEVMQAAEDSSAIEVVDEAFTAGWNPANAEANFRRIYEDQDGKIDAVVASNDGTAGAVAKVLAEKGKTLPLSGQDGDKAALNRVAKGEQTVSVWKDARKLGARAGRMALALAQKTALSDCGATMFTTPSGKKLQSILLAPVAITKDNLQVVLDADWISKADLCKGNTSSAAACQ